MWLSFVPIPVIIVMGERTHTAASYQPIISNVRDKDFVCLPALSVMLVLPPMDSETGFTGDLWS